jgi:hypothetical protein
VNPIIRLAIGLVVVVGVSAWVVLMLALRHTYQRSDVDDSALHCAERRTY